MTLKDQLQTADTLVKNSEYAKAEQIYRTVLEKNPNHFGSLIQIGKILRFKKMPAKSMDYFKELNQSHPDNDAILFELGYEHEIQNEYNTAKQLYQASLNINQKRFAAQHGLARLLVKTNEVEQATQVYNNLITQFPEKCFLKLELAKHYQKQLNQSDAEKLYREIINEQPDHYNAQINLALMYRQQGKHDEALVKLSMLAENFPERFQVKIEKAKQLLECNKLDEACAQFKIILKDNPDHMAASLGLAKIKRLSSQHEKAIEIYNRLIQKQPKHIPVKLELASLYREIDSAEKAQSIYKKILEIAPDNFQALINLGRISRNKGNRQQALAYFELLSQKYPDNINCQIERAIELRESQHLTQCLQLLDTLQKRSPEHFQIYMQRGFCYKSMNMPGMMLKQFNKALSLQPDNLNICNVIAAENFSLGNIENAINLAKSILKKDPKHAGILNQIGQWYFLMKDYNQAIHYFQTAKNSTPLIVQPYIKLANTYLETGNLENALNVLKEAENQIGTQAEIIIAKSNFFWKMRYIHEAINIVEQGLKSLPDNNKLNFQLITYLIESGEFLSAKTKLDQIKTTDKTDKLNSDLKHAQINKEKWNIQTATQEYQTILDNHPGFLPARQGLLTLSLIQIDTDTAREHSLKICQNNLGIHKINGQTRKHRHDLYAQIIDEYEINQSILDKIKLIKKLEDKEQLNIARQLVLEDPDATAAAVFFCLQLRKAGYFSQNSKKGNHKIPRQIVQFWDQQPIPAPIKECSDSWPIHNPEYQHKIHNEITAQKFLKQHYGNDFCKAYKKARHPAQKADFFRLALLFYQGGIYADADDRCLKSLEQLFPEKSRLILWQEPLATLGNNFMASCPGHPVMQIALQSASESLLRGDKESIWLSTGPGLITRSVAFYIASNWNSHPLNNAEIHIMSLSELISTVGIHAKLAYKSTTNSWLIKENPQKNKLSNQFLSLT